MEIPAYQGIQIPLTCLQEGATESCFERHESNLHPLLLFLQNKVNVIISSTPYFSLDFKNSVPHISILCAFLRTACSHLTFLNFITMITYVGIHFVIFCILLIFFFFFVSALFEFSSRRPRAQSTDRPIRLQTRGSDNQLVSWAEGRDYSALQIVQTRSGAHITSYSRDTGATKWPECVKVELLRHSLTCIQAVVFNLMLMDSSFLFVLSACTLQSLFLPYGRTQSFTPVHNNMYIYGFMYFNLYVFRQETGRQTIQDETVINVAARACLLLLEH
jgi:hypothetical protein